MNEKIAPLVERIKEELPSLTPTWTNIIPYERFSNALKSGTFPEFDRIFKSKFLAGNSDFFLTQDEVSIDLKEMATFIEENLSDLRNLDMLHHLVNRFENLELHKSLTSEYEPIGLPSIVHYSNELDKNPKTINIINFLDLYQKHGDMNDLQKLSPYIDIISLRVNSENITKNELIYYNLFLEKFPENSFETLRKALNSAMNPEKTEVADKVKDPLQELIEQAKEHIKKLNNPPTNRVQHNKIKRNAKEFLLNHSKDLTHEIKIQFTEAMGTGSRPSSRA